MTVESKRRLVLTVIAILGLWPLGHRALVEVTGLSPWEGFGWAMYCVPHRRIAVQADPQFRNGEAPTPAPAELQEMIRSSLSRYTERRRAMGFWVAPKEYARVLFSAYPELEQLELTVEQHGVDRKTAFIVVQRTDRFVYLRP